MDPFRMVVADPPWLFGDSLPGGTRGASKQYNCMTQADLLAFPLPPIADDAILLLWRVASMQQEALDVAKAWGFTVKSEIVWEKLTKLGKPWFGMGRYTRASHETCLVCTRGRFVVADRSIRSRFADQVPVGADDKYIHSAKPVEIFQIAEKLAGRGPYLEVFARTRRHGWEAIGDELP